MLLHNIAEECILHSRNRIPSFPLIAPLINGAWPFWKADGDLHAQEFRSLHRPEGHWSAYTRPLTIRFQSSSKTIFLFKFYLNRTSVFRFKRYTCSSPAYVSHASLPHYNISTSKAFSIHPYLQFLNSFIPHRRYPHLIVVVVVYECSWYPESYTGGSVATGRATQAGQVMG
jgi:hypothetical protein